MVAVAIMAIILGGGEWLRRRRTDFLKRSEGLRWSEYVEGHGERRPEVRAYYDRLARKYEQAARSPWLPVEPDPPEPE